MSTSAQRLGKYELQQLLGRGGMAEVWKALDTQLHRYVAIKILHTDLQTDPGFVSRFAHEAQMVASLRHPNIVQIYDFQISEQIEEDKTIAYMVMEYIEGDTLAHYIHETSAQQQFPSGRDIVRLFTPISLALDYAHQRGTIHRDIKPANILLDKTRTTRNPMGEPILSDFGLAKVLTAPSQTIAGMVFGTPLYISPEQVQNKPLSNRTDLYALGVILYEIFTGVTPFRGDGVGVMVQHITHTPPDPQTFNPAISPALSRFLLKGIARHPEDRFASAAAMTAALASALQLPIPADINDALPLQDNTSLPAPENPPSDELPAASGHVIVEEQDNKADAKLSTSASISGETVAMPDSDPYLITPEPVNEDEGSDLAARQTIPPHIGETLAVQYHPAARQQPTMITPAPPVFSPPSVPVHRKRNNRRIIVSAIAIILLLGAGLGTLFLYRADHSSATTTNSTVFGQAYFVSSGQTQGQNAIPFGNDEFQISLNHIPNPRPGKSYYAWLLPDNNQGESATLLLGTLSVNHGNIQFLYTDNSQHTNLLASYSRFLITEESSSIMPSIPTPDLTAWRYYAVLPQSPAVGQPPYSLLDHLRHLLADDPEIASLGLKGGLDTWAYRNTNRIQQWANTAQSDWHAQDYTSLHRFVVSILDYLDGSTLVQQDVPPGTTLATDPVISQIGMLEIVPGQKLPGYLFHIALHLNGVLSSPGATPYQRQLAIKINTGINNMNGWLGKVRADAISLAHMDNAHLALSSSLTLLNDMALQAHNAYFGQNTSSAGQMQGMSQIYVTAQRLATFNVTAYK